MRLIGKSLLAQRIAPTGPSSVATGVFLGPEESWMKQLQLRASAGWTFRLGPMYYVYIETEEAHMGSSLDCQGRVTAFNIPQARNLEPREYLGTNKFPGTAGKGTGQIRGRSCESAECREDLCVRDFSSLVSGQRGLRGRSRPCEYT